MCFIVSLIFAIMLQRIQSVYLGLAVLLSVGLFVWPIGSFSADNSELILSVFGLTTTKGEIITMTYPIVILTGIITFLLLFQVFNFKRRIRQIQTGIAVIVLIVFWYLINGIYIYHYFMDFDIFLSVKPSVGAFIPLAMIVFILLGNKYIRKDEELVRSVDRIR